MSNQTKVSLCAILLAMVSMTAVLWKQAAVIDDLQRVLAHTEQRILRLEHEPAPFGRVAPVHLRTNGSLMKKEK